MVKAMRSTLMKECRRRKLDGVDDLDDLQLLRRLVNDDKKYPLSKRQEYKTAHSDRHCPLQMPAKKYVAQVCKGDITKAVPEWVKGSKGKVKLMVAVNGGSKTGATIRWNLEKNQYSA